MIEDVVQFIKCRDKRIGHWREHIKQTNNKQINMQNVFISGYS
jgi:hypothetical protein